MLSTYRDVLVIPGAVRFSAAGFVARLPLAMIVLGIVVYISGITGSYAEAGILAACFQIPAAAFALLTSRWVDRFGQRRVLPLLALVHAFGLIAFVVAVQSGMPLIVEAIAIAVAGASQPSIGAVVRARWAYLLRRDGKADQLRSAFAVESIVDEFIFTLGPILVTVLALQVALPAPLILAAICSFTGSVVLAALRKTAPPPSAAPEPNVARTAAIRLPGMPLALIASLCLGLVFGSYEVTVVAFTRQAEQPGASGVVLALWALGSMIAGLWFGARHWRMHLPTQAAISTALLTVVLLPSPFVHTVPMLAIVTFIGGAGVAPALIATFSLTERLVPSDRLTEGLTWSTSGLAFGVSAGSAVGGIVIDSFGTSAAFCLPIAGALLASLSLGLGRHRLISSIRPFDADDPVAIVPSDPIPGPAPGTFLDDAR